MNVAAIFQHQWGYEDRIAGRPQRMCTPAYLDGFTTGIVAVEAQGVTE